MELCLATRPVLRLAGCLLLLAAMPAAGGEPGVIDIVPDQASVVMLGEMPKSVILGNPAIADVVIENGRLLIITGKAPGETNLIVLNAEGRELASHVLRVGGHASRFVAIYRGAKRQTLYCSPLCESALSSGDHADHVAASAAAIARKIEIVRRAAGMAASAAEKP